jgi:hypothetical protein
MLEKESYTAVVVSTPNNDVFTKDWWLKNSRE